LFLLVASCITGVTDEDEYVPDEAEVTPDGVDSGHGIEQGDIQAWRTRGTTGLSQCGSIEMMSSMVDIEARILHPLRPPLLNCSRVCNVELSFVSS
jgi:hypothetical protein